MKNLGKVLGIAGITAISFLPMKSNAQIFKNSSGEIFNLTDTLNKYNNNKNYVINEDSWKMGYADNPSGHQNTISISRKGDIELGITLQFDDRKNSAGDYIIAPGYLSYKTRSFKEINENSILYTSIEKFYGEQPSLNPEAYSTKTKSFAKAKNSKDELVIKDNEGNDLHYLFLYSKQGTAYDKIVYSTIIDGAQIIIKDSLYDKKLDYFSYTKEGHAPTILKNDAEIENATIEKNGIDKQGIYDWRDNFENERFCSFKQDLTRSLENLNKEYEKKGIKAEIH